MSKPERVVAEVPDLRKVKGHLYYLNSDGDLAHFRRPIGHYPRSRGPIRVARRLRIKKRRGYWYFLRGQQVIEIRRRGAKTPK